MAVLKMQKISICALKKDRKAILEQLQHLGVLEVDRDKEEDAFFQKKLPAMVLLHWLLRKVIMVT